METPEVETTLTEDLQQKTLEKDFQQTTQVAEKSSNQAQGSIQQQRQVQSLIDNLNINQEKNQVKKAKQNQEKNQIQNKDASQQHSENQQQNQVVHKKIQEASQEKQHQKQDISQYTYDYINVSKQHIQFGKSVLYPGSIEQVDLSIDLKNQLAQMTQASNNPFTLRVIAKCNNQQFNDLDEYVFSVRSNQRYEYFEEVRFKIKALQRAQVKVAVKIPPVKTNYSILGVLEVQLENLKPFSLPIKANCEVPSIICLKNLYKTDESEYIIKVPGKKNQVRMPPIPFKNMANYNFTLQVQAISNQNFSKRPYDIVVQNFVNCQANSQFFVNIQLKQNMSYQGPMPTRDTIRKILIFKIKNSSVYFNFPLQVHVFQSSISNGMS